MPEVTYLYEYVFVRMVLASVMPEVFNKEDRTQKQIPREVT